MCSLRFAFREMLETKRKEEASHIRSCDDFAVNQLYGSAGKHQRQAGELPISEEVRGVLQTV